MARAETRDRCSDGLAQTEPSDPQFALCHPPPQRHPREGADPRRAAQPSRHAVGARLRGHDVEL